MSGQALSNRQCGQGVVAQRPVTQPLESGWQKLALPPADPASLSPSVPYQVRSSAERSRVALEIHIPARLAVEATAQDYGVLLTKQEGGSQTFKFHRGDRWIEPPLTLPDDLPDSERDKIVRGYLERLVSSGPKIEVGSRVPKREALALVPEDGRLYQQLAREQQKTDGAFAVALTGREADGTLTYQFWQQGAHNRASRWVGPAITIPPGKSKDEVHAAIAEVYSKLTGAPQLEIGPAEQSNGSAPVDLSLVEPEAYEIWKRALSSGYSVSYDAEKGYQISFRDKHIGEPTPWRGSYEETYSEIALRLQKALADRERNPPIEMEVVGDEAHRVSIDYLADRAAYEALQAAKDVGFTVRVTTSAIADEGPATMFQVYFSNVGSGGERKVGAPVRMTVGNGEHRPERGLDALAATLNCFLEDYKLERPLGYTQATEAIKQLDAVIAEFNLQRVPAYIPHDKQAHFHEWNHFVHEQRDTALKILGREGVSERGLRKTTALLLHTASELQRLLDWQESQQGMRERHPNDPLIAPRFAGILDGRRP